MPAKILDLDSPNELWNKMYGAVSGTHCGPEVAGLCAAEGVLQCEHLAKAAININFLCKGFLLEIRRSVFRGRVEVEVRR